MNDAGLRRCSTCGTVFPNTAEFFYKGMCQCKNCVKKKHKQYYEANRERTLERTKKWQEAHREHKSQYNAQYYEANSERLREGAKQYYEVHRERIRERSKQYYEAHREHILQYNAQYREANKEQIAEWMKQFSKQYYEANRERIREGAKQYYEANREVFRIRVQRRKARIKELPYTLTREEWEQALKYFGYRCAYCGKLEKLTQEHFIAVSHGGGYEKYNIIPACGKCNSSKGHRPFSCWYHMQPFYSEEREKRILQYVGMKGATA